MILSLSDIVFNTYAKVDSYPLIIQICIQFIFGCLLLFLLFLVIIGIGRYRHNRKNSREYVLTPALDELIFKHLMEDEPSSPELIRDNFTKCVGTLSSSNLNLIGERLIFYKNNFNIPLTEPYDRIILALGLEKHIEKMLNFTSSYSKMKGIQMLSALTITAAESNIFPFTYSRNKNIRREARTSYLLLSKNDPYKFLDESNDSLNNWDKIGMMKQLLNMDRSLIPNFSKLINYSENETVVDFAIKMAAYFNQQDAIPVLTEQLKSHNHNIRAEVIKALGELRAFSTEAILKDMHHIQPANCQLEIIRAIGKFQTGYSLKFLRDAFDKATSTDIRKAAAEALLNYGEEGRYAFRKLISESGGFTLDILRHVENPLIKFK